MRRLGSLGGHSWSSLAAGIAVWTHRQISLYDWSFSASRNPNLFNSALLHLSPQRTTSSYFVTFSQQATINHKFLPIKVVIGFVNINSQVSTRTLYQSPSVNQPLSQHRHTWLRASHSGYNMFRGRKYTHSQSWRLFLLSQRVLAVWLTHPQYRVSYYKDYLAAKWPS